MKLTRKLAALAMAVLLAVSLTACSPKEWAQNVVVHLVHKLGLVEESDEEDTDTTTKAPQGGSVEFPAEMDTDSARVVTYPMDDTLYVSFNGIANRSTEYCRRGRRQHDRDRLCVYRGQQRELYVLQDRVLGSFPTIRR